MKKIHLIVAFIATSTLAFSQALQKAPSFETIKKAEKSITSNNDIVKAQGVSIWSSDFSTASNWIIGGNGNQGAWQIGPASSLPNPTYYNTIASTTAANGFAFFDGIQYLLAGSVDTQNAWIEMANSINCNTETVVTLKFEQAYRAFNYDKTYVEVSLNGGTTWEQTTDINPTNTAGTNSTETTVYRNFNVNNSSTVKFRFRWENTNGDNQYGSGYAWQVDDVNILTLSDHDIGISNYVYGTSTANETLFYYQIPLTQTAPIEGAAVLKNQGSQNQTNVVFTATESLGGAYTGTSPPIALTSGLSDSVIVTTNFTPGSVGNYQLDYSISYNNTDDNPTNNTVEPYKFSVGTTLYARDSSTQAEIGTRYGRITGSTQTPASAIQIGNAYTINSMASLTGIDFQFGDVISPGSVVFGEILDANLNSITNGETLPYTVVSGDEDTYHTLAFSSPINLAAGQDYVVIVKSFEPDFSVATAGKSAPQTTYIHYYSDATWYYTTSTPVVRMNFGAIIGSTKSSISGLAHIIGTPSTADSLKISGSNLTGNMTVTAPTNFEVSNALNGPFTQNLTLTQTGGAVAPTKVYVRLNGPIENLNQAGNLIISTPGSNDKLVALSGKTMPECNVDVSVIKSGAVITANATGLNYQWLDCNTNTNIAGETGVSFTATVNGDYAVIITDGPCIDTSACTSITEVGLDDNDFKGVSVFPNPVNDILKISNENGTLKSVEIVTATGRIVYSSKISSSEFSINVTEMSSGVYFVNVRSANSAKTFKVLK